MSAIDFNMDMVREASNKGDRAKLTMSGKFPPHKSYGNNDDRPEYELKA
ncbi:cyanate lyase [Methylobacterium fujisawaense]|uniref:Cyanate lyase n=1 Tax=Methylobacterium fujisawaense TaxID=107400 RepID=A0ABR6D5Z4_9HYPH|nr:cyanate lyase [Methylobacterium fujisawaense]